MCTVCITITGCVCIVDSRRWSVCLLWTCAYGHVHGHVYRYCSLIVCSKALYCSVSSRLRITDSRASPQRLTWLHKPWELFQIIQWARKDELHSGSLAGVLKRPSLLPVAVNSIMPYYLPWQRWWHTEIWKDERQRSCCVFDSERMFSSHFLFHWLIRSL